MAYDIQKLFEKKKSFKLAEDLLRRVAVAFPADKSALYDSVANFIESRFLVSIEECGTDDISVMAETSIKKISRMKEDGYPVEDKLYPGCAGITSSDAKKIQLFLALQRIFEISFDPCEVPYISDIGTLTETIIRLRTETVRPE